VAVFQTFRTDGSLQFDAALMTMALISKGTVYTQSRVAGNSNASSVLVPLPDLTSPFLVAFSARFVCARAGAYSASGTPVAHFASNGAIGSPVNYWIFGRTDRFPPSGGAGLELFNEQGQMTYSSRRPIATIAGILTDVQQSTTLASARTYAVAVPDWVGRHLDTGARYRNGKPYFGGTNGTTNYTWGWRPDGKLYGGAVADNVISTGLVSYDDVIATLNFGPQPADPSPAAVWTHPMGTSLILDVTGL